MSLFDIVSQLQGYRVAINGRGHQESEDVGSTGKNEGLFTLPKSDLCNSYYSEAVEQHTRIFLVTKCLLVTVCPSLDLRGLGVAAVLGLLCTSLTPDISLGHATALHY